jgi:Protein of unknown function (DUF2505)
VHLRLEQVFTATVEEVEAVFIDPNFIAGMAALPTLGRPELVDQRRDGDTVTQRVRYHFAGQLSPAVTRVIDPAKLVWVEEVVFDLAAHTAPFRILPENYADRLTCAGTYRFEPDGPDRSRRQADGELKVRYPLVGGAVERAIASGLAGHADQQAVLVSDWLDGRRSGAN